MLDRFGTALIGAASAVSTALRSSGRTTRMIESLTPNCIVIFASERSADEASRRARELGKGPPLRFMVADPREHPIAVAARAMSGDRRRRVVFDHFWIECHYRYALEDMARDLAKASETPVGPTPAEQARDVAAEVRFVAPDTLPGSSTSWSAPKVIR